MKKNLPWPLANFELFELFQPKHTHSDFVSANGYMLLLLTIPTGCSSPKLLRNLAGDDHFDVFLVLANFPEAFHPLGLFVGHGESRYHGDVSAVVV
jgi:hypothetical protein